MVNRRAGYGWLKSISGDVLRSKLFLFIKIYYKTKTFEEVVR